MGKVEPTLIFADQIKAGNVVEPISYIPSDDNRFPMLVLQCRTESGYVYLLGTDPDNAARYVAAQLGANRAMVTLS